MARTSRTVERAEARAEWRTEWHVVYAVVALVIIGLFLYSVRLVLSPFVLFVLLLYILSPYAGTRLHLLVVSAAAALGTLWVLETTGFLLAPFILAFVLAYIFNPAVDALQRRGMPRWLAILTLALPAVLALAAGILFGIPAVVEQASALSKQLPGLVERWVAQARATLTRVDLPLIDERVLLQKLDTFDSNKATQYLEVRQELILRRMWGAVLGLGRGLATLLSIIGYVVLTPVLTFYLLRDYKGLTERIRGLIPGARRERYLSFWSEYDALLSRYLRGQVTEAAIVGVLTWLALWLLGFPFAGLVGAVAGVFNIVPYLGLVASLVPAVIIAILSGSVVASLLKVAGVFVVVQFLDSTILGPRIVGGSVGLHPVLIILAIAVGGFFLGFVGLLLAIPAALLLKLLMRGALARYRRSDVYMGSTAASSRTRET